MVPSPPSTSIDLMSLWLLVSRVPSPPAQRITRASMSSHSEPAPARCFICAAPDRAATRPALILGRYVPLAATGGTIAFIREDGAERLSIAPILRR